MVSVIKRSSVRPIRPCSDDRRSKFESRPAFKSSITYFTVWLNTAKDCKGPQRTLKKPTKDRKGALRAKLQEIGTNWTQWCLPVRPKIFHMLPDLVENLRSLIASQYAEADHAICGCGNFILRLSNQKHRLSVADWKALSEPQQQRIRHAVFSLACEGVAAWHTVINIYWWQPDCPAPSRIQMLGRNWEVVVDQVPTAQNKKQKLINLCRGLKMVVS